MFRRKDETVNDPSNPTASVSGSQQPSGGSAGYTEGSSASSAPSSPAQSAPAASSASSGSSASNTYVPGGAPASGARSAPHEPARTPSAPATPAAAASNYRPTPIAEFNRGASRSPSEPMRAPSAGGSTGFGGGDKSSGGTKSNRRVLTVGNDILLKGEIATCDRLVIEGRVEAKLSEVHTVEIAEAGSFKGTAEVEDAEISGVFEGDLIVRNRLVIYATGEVRGNITYGEIEIERGGKMTGQIKTVAGAAQNKGKPFEGEKRKENAA